MSSFDCWTKDIRVRLNDLQDQLSETSGGTSSPRSPSTSQLIHRPTSPPFTSPFLPFPGSSCQTNPLFTEDPDFQLLESSLVFGALNFDLPDPEIKMPSLREENGQVHGNEEEGRPNNITYPAVADGKSGDFEMRGGFFHQIPKFHGLSGEDPNQHLQLFEFTCESMCPRGADIQYVKMRNFPFTLEDKARTWLFSVPRGRIVSWASMRKEFLQKYFPSSRVTQIRKEITSVKQERDEAFDVYYERFKALVSSCPNHGIREGLLLQYFYEGLLPLERQFLDSAAGGALMEKSKEEVTTLLEMRATANQQFGSFSMRRAKEEASGLGSSSDIFELKEEMGKLTLLVSKLAKGRSVNACGVCSIEGHTSNQCPQVVEGSYEEANALGFPQQQGGQRFQNFNPRANEPNFRWNNNTNVLNPQPVAQGAQPSPYVARPQGQYMLRPYQPHGYQGGQPSGGSNYDEIFKNIATSTQSLLATTQSNTKDIAELKNQMGKVVDFMGQIQEQGKLPGGTIPNPRKEQAQAITTRSGKVLQPSKPKQGQLASDDEGDNVVIEQIVAEPHVNVDGEAVKAKKKREAELEASKKRDLEKDPATSKKEQVPDPVVLKGNNSNLNNLVLTNQSCLPFPSRFSKTKKAKEDEEVLEIFRKVQVNIPLIDCLKQIPRYAKFLKELCTQRRHTRETQVVKMSEAVSAAIQRKLPPKMKDPGSFTIPCIIGSTKFDNVMLDLGASINVMSHSVYKSLGLGPLKKDSVIIQLADRSNKYPEGYVDDVLVQVNHLIFLADFYVLEMEDSPNNSTQLLLGRPFMRTARTKIDVAEGNLTMEFDGEKICFNVFEAMRYPVSELKPCFAIDVVESCAQVLSGTMEA